MRVGLNQSRAYFSHCAVHQEWGLGPIPSSAGIEPEGVRRSVPHAEDGRPRNRRLWRNSQPRVRNGIPRSPRLGCFYSAEIVKLVGLTRHHEATSLRGPLHHCDSFTADLVEDFLPARFEFIGWKVLLIPQSALRMCQQGWPDGEQQDPFWADSHSHFLSPDRTAHVSGGLFQLMIVPCRYRLKNTALPPKRERAVPVEEQPVWTCRCCGLEPRTGNALPTGSRGPPGRCWEAYKPG